MRARLVVALTALACAMLVAPVPDADAATYRYAVIGFHKNHANTLRSSLTWDVYRVTDGHRSTLVHHRWRAGSGFTRHSTDACRKNDGWLPNGRYRPEHGAGSRQCANRPGDQACRWEYPAIDDYRSRGCIKLSPGDLHELYDAWRRYFRLGYSSHVQVRVS